MITSSLAILVSAPHGISWVHWHNHERLHHHLDDASPVEFETVYYDRTADKGWLKSDRLSHQETLWGSMRLGKTIAPFERASHGDVLTVRGEQDPCQYWEEN